MVKDIPLIIPNFNQLSYLRNLVNQFHFYYPENKIYIVDNHSTYEHLLDYYSNTKEIEVHRYATNDFSANLIHFLGKLNPEYYIISDPDISIHPSTHPNFLEVFKTAIDNGFHHAGFDLITEGLPDWLYKREHIIGDEKMCRIEKVVVAGHEGYRGAIDTTFCLYTSKNSGWSSPMDGKDWVNGCRLFSAFHMKWYQHPDFINSELDYYFKTANYRDFTKPSAGRNYYRPPQYINE